MSLGVTSGPRTTVDPQGRRLESWKEIASYLGRDITTVRRWEKREGLPVHRLHHSRLGSVYAYTAELDAWRRERAPAPAIGEMAATQPPETVRRNWKLIPLVALGLILVGSLAWLWRQRSLAPFASASSPVRSLAVLPLDNLSGNHDQDYLADGMTEALIGRLATIQGLRVISRTSSMQFKAPHSSVPEIARKLNVQVVVEGSVIRSGDRIRITAQLIQGDTDLHLWSGTFDRELRDVLALESEVAQSIARQIEVAVTGQERSRLAAIHTVSHEVYESYLKGRFALHQYTQAGFNEAIAHFEDAIRREPTFAPAFAGLAATYSGLGLVFYGAPPHEVRPKVLAAARKALELDPDLVEARVQLADALQKDWHWAEAEAEYKQAIALSPNDSEANATFSYWFLCQGRTQEALSLARRAQELDPLALHGIEIGWILFQARRYDEAIRELRTVLTIAPENPMALWFFGYALTGAGQFDEAIQMLEKAASVSNRSSAVLGVLAHAYACAGRRAEALRVLDELHRRRKAGYVPPAAFLNAYTGLGDKEEAFAWMERAAEERSNILQFLKVHPFFDLLRGDPRFAAYVRRANLQ
jgi:TolB-like protein/Tfp pilus assembly protein PilF